MNCHQSKHEGCLANNAIAAYNAAVRKIVLRMLQGEITLPSEN